jgi:2-iminoacetate synthase ThiH
MSILEIHGIADADKVMMMTTERQHVIVKDGDGKVFLDVQTSAAAGMTPDQARMIAKHLELAADRVEKAKKAAHLQKVGR